jgi:diketogulonate reductase-like aldo/keto reductase
LPKLRDWAPEAVAVRALGLVADVAGVAPSPKGTTERARASSLTARAESLELGSTLLLRAPDGQPSVAIPRLGLGVFRAGPGQPTRVAVETALEHGYRHVDTARVYRNEAAVGAALRASGLRRSEVFITTKLWNEDQGYEQALRGFDASLAALGLDFVDLYLIHWPVAERRQASWRALERIHGEGRARAIGVSNFMVRHLDELRQQADLLPAVNQIELHPYGQQREVVRWCREHGVALQAYTPLTRGQRLNEPTLFGIANQLHKTPAQVLVRWSLQRGFVVLPKSSNPTRIVENANVFDFELSQEQMAELDVLDEGLHVAWDPSQAL